MAFVQVKKCLTDPKQLVKLILLVICICITIYQLSECMAKLIWPPITSYYVFNLNETIKYPSISICRKKAYKTDLWPNYGIPSGFSSLYENNVFKYFKFDTVSIEDFLKNTSYNYYELFGQYGFKGEPWNTSLNRSEFFLISRGLCHTLHPTQNSDAFAEHGGYYIGLKHTVTTAEKVRDSYGRSMSGFELYLHTEDEIVADDDNNNAASIWLESAENMQVTLSLQMYSMINRNNRPCNAEVGYSKSKCLESCIHNQVAMSVGCTTSWLRYLNDSYPTCSDFTSVNNLIRSFSNKNLYNQYLAACNCPISCNNTLFKYHIEERRDALEFAGGASTINIYFDSNLIMDFSEVTNYDGNSFLADVGGSLGFLLGLSVIGIFTIIEELIRIICRRKRKTVLKEDSNNEKINLTQIEQPKNINQIKNILDYSDDCVMAEQKENTEKF